MDKNIITSNELKNQNRVIWTDKNPLGTARFSHYTTANSMNKILDSEEFRVSKINRMNDLKEKERYAIKGDSVFCLCFCNSDSEKIPMWYLYAGVSGKGMRLSYTTAKMKAFLQSIKIVYPVINKVTNRDKPLYLDSDFSLNYGWIYYVKSNKTSEIKYKGKLFTLSDSYDSLQNDNFFIKDYPWEYEKEFRILFDFSSYKSRIGSIAFDKIAVPISINDVKLMFAPESNDAERASTLEGSGFKKYLSGFVDNSHLDISMGLLDKDIPEMLNILKKSISDSDNRKEYAKDIKDLLALINH